MHSFLKPLNHQHSQHFADKPVAHSLPRAFRRLIDMFSTPVKHLLQVEVHVSELLSNKPFFVSNISTWTLAMFTQRCTNSFFPCSDNDPFTQMHETDTLKVENLCFGAWKIKLLKTGFKSGRFWKDSLSSMCTLQKTPHFCFCILHGHNNSIVFKNFHLETSFQKLSC